MTKLLHNVPFLDTREQYGIWEDFLHTFPGEGWAVVEDAAATQVAADGVKGILVIATAAVDNDEAYVHNDNEVFKFAAGKPFVFEALVDFTEIDTDKANIVVGVVDAVAADLMVDDGGGPKASYSGALFFKVDGGTLWQCETSISTAQTTETTDVTAGGGTYQRLRIECRSISSTQGEVAFFIDGQQCRDSNGNLIKQVVTFASATEMQLVVGVKAGSGAVETLNVDFAGCEQLR